MGSKKLMTVAVLTAVFSLLAQAQGPKLTLEQELESEYKLTTPTADNREIVTMGAVLILQKKGFSAGNVANKIPTQSTYQDGQIKSGAATTARRLAGLRSLSAVPGIGSLASLAGVAGTAASAAGPSRDFVNGERLYVTEITVDRSKDTIVFDLISDAYGDAGRYRGSLRFPFPKGSVASADLAQVRPIIVQVFKIGSVDQNAAAVPTGQAAAPATASAAFRPPAPVADVQPAGPLEPIAPPPPPPPDPVIETKAIEIGQTKDQVVAILGKPDKTFKVGTKEIYQYKDVKVTFVNGKMTDAQ